MEDFIMSEELINSDFFKNLPEEVREKLLKCKSEEEAMDILRDNMIEVPAEELKKVAGGFEYGCDDFSTFDTY